MYQSSLLKIEVIMKENGWQAESDLGQAEFNFDCNWNYCILDQIRAYNLMQKQNEG